MSDNQEHINPGLEVPEEPSSLKLILALGLAGLLSGIILVGTFIYTAPLIKANKEAATQRAIFNVLPNCTSSVALQLENGKLIEQIVDPAKSEDDKDALLIYAGYNDQNELVGFAIPGAETGFQDIIGVLFGYNGFEKEIIGFEVLESKETPGLGDKIFKDADFQKNFKSLAVNPEIIPVKKGEKKNENEVEAITGATISSKAVVRLLNNTVAIWQTAIDDYIQENNISISKKDE
jgi:electron transport complex protein RnfG